MAECFGAVSAAALACLASDLTSDFACLALASAFLLSAFSAFAMARFIVSGISTGLAVSSANSSSGTFNSGIELWRSALAGFTTGFFSNLTGLSSGT